MLSILVASSKGGCGKSTLSTALAAYFALAGKRSVLIDADPQHSASRWCARREHLAHPVLAIDGTRKRWARLLPDDTQRLVIDSPAGSSADSLGDWLQRADAVIVPVQPAAVDLEASADFVAALRASGRTAHGRPAVGLVGNRLRPWTQASQQAVQTLRGWPYPLVAELRESQAYALLVGLGKSLFDYQSQAVRQQQQEWDPLFAWLREVNRMRRR